MHEGTMLEGFHLMAAAIGLPLVIRSWKRNGPSAGMASFFMVFAAYVFLWSLVLDRYYDYSRRGMEAFVYLLMWIAAGISFLLGFGLHCWSQRRRKP